MDLPQFLVSAAMLRQDNKLLLMAASDEKIHFIEGFEL
jgi:hypothetical protein